jgi:hypothetical protein
VISKQYHIKDPSELLRFQSQLLKQSQITSNVLLAAFDLLSAIIKTTNKELDLGKVKEHTC